MTSLHSKNKKSSSSDFESKKELNFQIHKRIKGLELTKCIIETKFECKAFSLSVDKIGPPCWAKHFELILRTTMTAPHTAFHGTTPFCGRKKHDLVISRPPSSTTAINTPYGMFVRLCIFKII